MSESEWLACDWPYDLLTYLDGKLAEEAFMRFSVRCCRRIWPLLADARSQAALEAIEAYLAGQLTADAAEGLMAPSNSSVWRFTLSITTAREAQMSSLW